jgi:hypothetical protein
MWYYVEDGQQRGPVAEADLAALQRDGKINSETLVWREGMTNWQPLAEAKPAATAAATAGGLLCAECGNAFAPDQVIRLNDRWVCAACKPVFLQRLREGTFGGSAPVGSAATEAQVRERDYEHDIGGYLNQAWQLFKSDPGSIIGTTVLVGLCLIVASFIPYLGTILGAVFGGPLMGGLYLFYLKKIRGQTATLGDGFSGFGPRFGQLLLARFIPNLLAGLALIPVVIVVVMLLFFSMGPLKNPGPTSLSSLTFGVPLVIGGLFVLAGVCVMIYLAYCWFFTLWLVADKNMTFWPAMSLSRAVVRKHWWQTFLLGIVSGLLTAAGVLMCGVGLLVTAPVAIAMWAYAYEKLFGDMQPA